MVSSAVLLAACIAGFDEPAAATEEHPVTAAVRASLEHNGGRVDRPFTLVVALESGKPRQLIEAFRAPLVETRKEEGNIMYLLNQDSDEPTKFLLLERWKSLDALDEHLAQPYLVQLLKDLDELASVELRVLRPVGGRGKPKKAATKD